MTAEATVEHVLCVPTLLFHELGHFQGFNAKVDRYLQTLLDPAHTSFRPRNEVDCPEASGLPPEVSGFPPTRAEIARSMGFRSVNAAEQHLRALEKKGVIEILSGASRGIRVKDTKIGARGARLLELPVIGRVAAGSCAGRVRGSRPTRIAARRSPPGVWWRRGSCRSLTAASPRGSPRWIRHAAGRRSTRRPGSAPADRRWRRHHRRSGAMPRGRHRCPLPFV